MAGDRNPNSFTTGNSAQEKGLNYVSDGYQISSSNPLNVIREMVNIPVIDMARLRQEGSERLDFIREIAEACRRYGFFQVVNHGICQETLDGALAAAFGFFDLPAEEKLKFKSSDVFKEVRYSSSIKDGVDKVQFWRVFLKHYAYPLEKWVGSWPENPPDYRQKMGNFSTETRNLALELTEAITESLGLGPKYITAKMEDGMQVMAVNCYPPCPQPSLALGLPPHSDYTCLTILLQSSPGLEILDSEDENWRLVPELGGALQVHVGDHLEVLSNGIYKSVVHRATLNEEKTRVSIASLHSLAMDEKMETAMELVDEEHPKGHKGSSFKDFLKYLAKNEVRGGKMSFIDTLKIPSD